MVLELRWRGPSGAESAVVSVVRRTSPVVVAPREVIARALAALYPFDVQVSVGESQVSMWLDQAPVHGVGATYEEAEKEFLDALLDYAELWVDELKSAPNHRGNEGLVSPGSDVRGKSRRAAHRRLR